MKKFVFKLQTVFELRENNEESKKLEYSKALNEYTNEDNKLSELNCTFKNTLNDNKNEMQKGIKPESINIYNKYLLCIKKNIENQQIKVDKLRKLTDIKKNEMFKAITDRKAIEKLKDNEYKKFIKEQNAEEQRVIEEIVSYNYVLK